MSAVVYEVTLEFETALFQRTQITATVGSQDEVMRLRDFQPGDLKARFVSVRGPIAVQTSAQVMQEIMKEKAEHAKIASGGQGEIRADMRAIFDNGDNTHRFPR